MLHPVGFWAQQLDQVTAQANGDTNTRLTGVGGYCSVGAGFNTSGFEFECTNTGSFTVNQGKWLNSGSSSEVWVEFIRTGGTKSSWDHSGQSNNTRYQLSTTRNFEIRDTSALGGAQTIIGRFKFWDAATGGNVLDETSNATWSAEFILDV